MNTCGDQGPSQCALDVVDGWAPHIIISYCGASRGTMMNAEHSGWIGRYVQYHGVSCRSTENAHHSLWLPFAGGAYQIWKFRTHLSSLSSPDGSATTPILYYNTTTTPILYYNNINPLQSTVLQQQQQQLLPRPMWIPPTSKYHGDMKQLILQCELPAYQCKSMVLWNWYKTFLILQCIRLTDTTTIQLASMTNR